MTFWNPRVVKIISRIAAHPKPFHDSSRSLVQHRCIRYDFWKRERPERGANGQSGSLRCITASPMLESKTPTYFYTGGEMGTELWNEQSCEIR